LDRGRLRQAVFGMAALGNVLPALPAAGEEARRAATTRFNQAMLARAVSAPGEAALASPVLGSGIGLGPLDRILLGAAHTGGDLVAFTWGALCAMGHKLSQDGKPIQTVEDARPLIEDRIHHFRAALLPWLRQLGVGD
jgi:hypothetical protein